MWDKIFTASLSAYSVGLAMFLLGRHTLELYPMTLTGAALPGVTGFSIVLTTKSKT
jgi:hypothetical protein